MHHVFARFRLTVGLTGFLLAAAVGSAAGPQAVQWPDAGEQEVLQKIADLFLARGEVVKNDDGTLKSVSFKGRPKKDNASFSLRFDPKTQRVVQVVGNGAGITNEEYQLVAQLSDLTNLTLFHNSPGGDRSEWPTIADGAGLVAFKNNASLGTICLAGGPLDNDGLEAIAQLPQVDYLRIWHIAADDDGFKALRNHPGLAKIRVAPTWQPTITDATIEHLSTCPNLASLTYGEGYLTWENGLRHLTKLKGTLKTVDLLNTLIAPEDLDRFRQAMPDVEVKHEGFAEVGAALAGDDRRSKNALKNLQQWAPQELIDRAIAASKDAK